ncbi:TPA: hypothetical protein HA251_03110 [Candidatus Woesearchaeota archaeon]|nr:hypothetical protein [Candidatus Woesearchaeota archaeon]
MSVNNGLADDAQSDAQQQQLFAIEAHVRGEQTSVSASAETRVAYATSIAAEEKMIHQRTANRGNLKYDNSSHD